MTKIREATHEDIPGISTMMIDAYRSALLKQKGLRFNLEHVEVFIKFLIDSQDSVILVADVSGQLCGTIAGIISIWMGDFNQLIIKEVWWWVDTAWRGSPIGMRLVEVFENKAKELKIDFCMMGTHDSSNEIKLEETYLRLGYENLERNFIKRI